MTPIILGLDADTHRIAWAWLERDRIVLVGTIPRADVDGTVLPDYDRQIRAKFLSLVGRGRIVTEQPFCHRNIRTYGALSEVLGELRWIARTLNVPFHAMSPNDVHNRLGFAYPRSRLDAKQIMRAMAHRAWDCGLTQHEADAVCIALAGGIYYAT